MTKKTVNIQLENGLDTRPVAHLVQVASQFRSDVYLETGSRRVNAKSIMGMMTLGLDTGSEVTIAANGEDEGDAVAQLEAFLNRANA
ncbi:MAG: HPr family phosphocarrier protein [Lachnospiraceae bacterium]|nr:HPr family phosphocarrier protein [Lachnospiraceae bacterium]